MKAQDEDKIVGITYTSNDNIYQAWPASEAALQALQEEGIIKERNATCECGSEKFCSTINHRYYKCMSVTSDRCEWFETSEYC